MLKKTQTLELDATDQAETETEPLVIQLDSGRRVVVRTEGREDHLEVTSPNGELVLKMRLTDEGPVVSLEGVRLEMKAAESISLEARKVEVKASEEVSLVSTGILKIDSQNDIRLRSTDDIWVNGKMIYLNCDASVVKGSAGGQGPVDVSQVQPKKEA